MALPFAPSFKWAFLLFLCREALVEMDVPARQSYVAAVVLPNERTFASGLTNLAAQCFLGDWLKPRRLHNAESHLLCASRNWKRNEDRL